MEKGNEYSFYDDALALMEQSKPVPDVQSEDTIRRQAKLNTIGEGLRTVSELIGLTQGAPIERRGENQNLLKNLQDFNKLKADDANKQSAWLNKITNLKLAKAQAQAAGKAKKADQDFIAEENEKNRGAKDKIADDANKAKKYAVDNKKTTVPKTSGKKVYNPEEEIAFTYKDEAGVFHNDKAKAKDLKGVGLSLANMGFKELYVKYPLLSASVEALQAKGTSATDEDYINLGATIWNDVKDSIPKDTPTEQPKVDPEKAKRQTATVRMIEMVKGGTMTTKVFKAKLLALYPGKENIITDEYVNNLLK